MPDEPLRQHPHAAGTAAQYAFDASAVILQEDDEPDIWLEVPVGIRGAPPPWERWELQDKERLQAIADLEAKARRSAASKGAQIFPQKSSLPFLASGAA